MTPKGPPLTRDRFLAGPTEKGKERATKFGEYRRKKRRRPPVTVASLRLFLRSSTGPSRRFQPQSLGVRDPVRIAEGPTAIDAATQRRHFGFRLRWVDNLQPIGGAWQRPRREDGKRRVFALHTAGANSTNATIPLAPRGLHAGHSAPRSERPGTSSLLFPPGNTCNALDRDGRTRSRDDAPSTVSHACWSLAP